MKILFVGFAIPDDTMENISKKDLFPQIAAHNFQWSIIHGIEEASNSTIDIVSSIPVSDYPRFPQVLFGYRKWAHRDGAKNVMMPFVNVILLKHFSRLFFALAFISAWMYRNRKLGARCILVYAFHSPYVLAALIASRIFGGKSILIIPDLPSFSDAGIRRGMVRRAAKALDVLWLPWLARKFEGLVVVSRHIAEDLAIEGVPYLIVDNAIPAHQLVNVGDAGGGRFRAREGENIVMYAGGLTEEYGVRLLLDAFARIPEENYRLWICGKGAMESEIRERSLRDPRIVYWGFLPNKDVMEKERMSTVLVNARPSDKVFTRYSCPIKVLEFMLSGRPTITTALPGISDEYKEYLFFLGEETPDKLAELIRSVCAMTPEESAEFGRRASDFVRREKSYRRQGKRISDFVSRIAGQSEPGLLET
jgi:glycosyltransferase involved in cell wall biosynthesis